MDAASDRARGEWKLVAWLAAVGLAGVFGVLTAGAHDLWLEPEIAPPPATAAKGEESALHLRLGDEFKAEEERPLQKDHVARFDLFSDRAKRRDLLAAGQEGQQPAAKFHAESGASLAVMDRTPRPITMERDKFNKYLEDEGQEAITALRARLGQTEQAGKEIYTRYLKALIQERDPVGSIPSTLYKRRVGQRLEILLENDPGRMTSDKVLTVKVLFEGKPLAGAKVFAYRREAAEQGAAEALTAVTSAQGLADFKLDQTGVWLVRLVHFRASTERKPESTAAWESFWATYSFAVREAPVGVPVLYTQESDRVVPGHNVLAEKVIGTTVPIEEMLVQYRKDFGSFPDGDNSIIMRRLLGLNPKTTTYVYPDPDFVFDARGNLLDPWMEPYQFTFRGSRSHVFSSTLHRAVTAPHEGYLIYPRTPPLTKEQLSCSAAYKLALTTRLLVQQGRTIPPRSRLPQMLLSPPKPVSENSFGTDWPYATKSNVKQAMIDPWGSPYVIKLSYGEITVFSVHSAYVATEPLSPSVR